MLDCIRSYVVTQYFFVAPYPIDIASVEGEKIIDDNVRIMWKVRTQICEDSYVRRYVTT